MNLLPIHEAIRHRHSVRHYISKPLTSEMICMLQAEIDACNTEGNCIVLFYGNAGGYSYTRIGRITNTQGLAAAVGSGDVTVTFSVATTDLQSATSSRQATKRMVDGKVMVGDYTVDGKKL